jgi:hypothetical protein
VSFLLHVGDHTGCIACLGSLRLWGSGFLMHRESLVPNLLPLYPADIPE